MYSKYIKQILTKIKVQLNINDFTRNLNKVKTEQVNELWKSKKFNQNSANYVYI